MTGMYRLAALSLAAATLLWAGPASAERKQKPKQVRDTGVDEVVQTVEARNAEAALEAMTSRSDAGLAEVVKDDGTVVLDLEGRFMNVVLAHPTADGHHELTCQTGHEAVKQAASARTGTPRTAKQAAPTTDARELK